MADLSSRITLNASRFAEGIRETRAKLSELNAAFVENRNKMKELNKEAKDLQKQEQQLSEDMKDGGSREQHIILSYQSAKSKLSDWIDMIGASRNCYDL